jgi:hypothetical protein
MDAKLLVCFIDFYFMLIYINQIWAWVTRNIWKIDMVCVWLNVYHFQGPLEARSGQWIMDLIICVFD